MTDDIRTLVTSTARGRYALDDAHYGMDLTAGQTLFVLLDGHWFVGRIEYNHDPIYAQLGPQQLGERATGPDAIGGYYVQFADGTVCGLCAGMKVRLPA